MNRFLLFVVVLLFSATSFSQIESGIVKLNFGDKAHFDDISIVFVELISDSRCPKSVQCIRAGEAEVLVAVYRNGTFMHNKTLVFQASGLVSQKDVQLFNSESLNIQGLALYPYPTGTGKISEETYCLDLAIN